MRITLDINENLLNRALALSPGKTIDEVVSGALTLYITQDREKQLKILDLFGQVDFDPDWDYKAERRRR